MGVFHLFVLGLFVFQCFDYLLQNNMHSLQAALPGQERREIPTLLLVVGMTRAIPRCDAVIYIERERGEDKKLMKQVAARVT